MKAIIKPEAAPGLELAERPIPEPASNDVLIQVKRTSICGTDVHIDLWDDWAANTIKPPMIIGHEFVGEIVTVEDVHDFKVGDIVSGEGHIICGHCRNCMAGVATFVRILMAGQS